MKMLGDLGCNQRVCFVTPGTIYANKNSASEVALQTQSQAKNRHIFLICFFMLYILINSTWFDRI